MSNPIQAALVQADRIISTDTPEPYDAVGAVIAYEQDELDTDDTLVLFGHLVATGMAWRLQGHYGRQAAQLIELGYLDTDGNVLKWAED
jgi:hypothetical protein